MKDCEEIKYRFDYVHLLGMTPEEFDEFRQMFPDKTDKVIEKILIEVLMKALDSTLGNR